LGNACYQHGVEVGAGGVHGGGVARGAGTQNKEGAMTGDSAHGLKPK